MYIFSIKPLAFCDDYHKFINNIEKTNDIYVLEHEVITQTGDHKIKRVYLISEELFKDKFK